MTPPERWNDRALDQLERRVETNTQGIGDHRQEIRELRKDMNDRFDSLESQIANGGGPAPPKRLDPLTVLAAIGAISVPLAAAIIASPS